MSTSILAWQTGSSLKIYGKWLTVIKLVPFRGKEILHKTEFYPF